MFLEVRSRETEIDHAGNDTRIRAWRLRQAFRACIHTLPVRPQRQPVMLQGRLLTRSHLTRGSPRPRHPALGVPRPARHAMPPVLREVHRSRRLCNLHTQVESAYRGLGDCRHQRRCRRFLAASEGSQTVLHLGTFISDSWRGVCINDNRGNRSSNRGW